MKTIHLSVPDVYLPIFEETCPENVLNWGGRGAARSYTSGYKVLAFCMTCESDQTFYVGRYYKDDIEQSVYRQIKICAQDMGIKFLEENKDRIILDGGCEIRFESFKDELNLRSTPKTVGIWYEEAQQADSLINLMNLRATARRVPDKFLFIASMNRIKPNDAMWVLFKRLPDNEKLLTYACVWDNPFATGSVMKEWKDAKEQLARGDMTEDEYNLVWRGLPAMDGERTFYKFRFLEDAMDPGSDINPELLIGKVAGVDLSFGGTDFCVYTELDVYSDGKRRVARVETWKPISNADTSGRITQFVRDGNIMIVAVDAGDGGGKGIYQDLCANFPPVNTFTEYRAAQVEVVRYVPGVALKNSVVAGVMAANVRAYDHLKLRNDLELGKVYNLPTRFVDVMANIWKTATREGKFYIESKEENRKHTGRSPDENDSIVIANAMANKLLKDNEGDPRINALKKTFGFGNMKGTKTTMSGRLPKWL